MAEGTGQVKPFVKALPAYLLACRGSSVRFQWLSVLRLLATHIPLHRDTCSSVPPSMGTLLLRLRSSFSCMAALQSLAMDEKVENQGNVPTQTWNLSF